MVEFHDTDMAGIMHFASFFHYMESAEHELVRSLGLSIHSQRDGEALSFPRVHAACRYQSPARCEEVLDIEIVVAKLGQTSVTYEFQFRHEGRDVALGEITCVCCLITPEKPLRPVGLPQDVMEKLRAFQP